MRWILSILSVVLTLTCFGTTHASKAEVPDFTVRAVEHNSDEVFPTLMTLIEARQALEAKEFERAYELYSILYKYDADLGGVTEGLSKVFIALGRPDMARDCLLRADNLSPEMGVLLKLSTAMTLPAQQSELYLRQALTTQQDSRLWNLLGLKLGNQGKVKLASNAFHNAESLGQNSGVLMNNLGLLALQEGDFSGAAKYLSISAQSAPENEKFDNNRRLALLLNQQYADALNDLPTPRLVKLLEDAVVISKKCNKPYLELFLLDKLQHIDPVFNQIANDSLMDALNSYGATDHSTVHRN